MLITSISDFRKAIRNGPYAWPGGYPLYWIMADGEAVAFSVPRKGTHERHCFLCALANPGLSKQWQPIALEINWEDDDLICAHTNKRIPCAYGD